jgi:hypothetical protein
VGGGLALAAFKLRQVHKANSIYAQKPAFASD